MHGPWNVKGCNCKIVTTVYISTAYWHLYYIRPVKTSRAVGQDLAADCAFYYEGHCKVGKNFALAVGKFTLHPSAVSKVVTGTHGVTLQCQYGRFVDIRRSWLQFCLNNWYRTAHGLEARTSAAPTDWLQFWSAIFRYCILMSCFLPAFGHSFSCPSFSTAPFAGHTLDITSGQWLTSMAYTHRDVYKKTDRQTERHGNLDGRLDAGTLHCSTFISASSSSCRSAAASLPFTACRVTLPTFPSTMLCVTHGVKPKDRFLKGDTFLHTTLYNEVHTYTPDNITEMLHPNQQP